MGKRGFQKGEYSHSIEIITRMSITNRRVFTNEIKKKISLTKIGKPGRVFTLEQRKHLSEMRKGSNNPCWRGGTTSINELIRTSTEYKEWRMQVFKRDNYTCQICFQHGGSLQADHIKPFAYFPELRLELSNGRTLCEKCHKNTDTYGNKSFVKRSTIII